MAELPRWLRDRETDDPKFARQLRYFRLLYAGTPKAMTPKQRQEYRAIYRECRRRRRKGENVQVDHIVPIVSRLVCGLNVPWNLAIEHASINSRKGNRWWPHCPHGVPGELFKQLPDPHQLSLALPAPLERVGAMLVGSKVLKRKEDPEEGQEDICASLSKCCGMT